MKYDSSVITLKKKHLWIGVTVITAVVGLLLIIPNVRKDNTAGASADTKDAKLVFAQALGKEAPDFSLVNIDGQTVNLRDLKGKTVVLFFNEGSMCFPACWNQVKELAADSRLNSADVVSYSIVVESPQAWKEIMQKRPEYQTSRMLFDTTRKVSQSYDVLSLTSSMHKGAYPGHTFVVIGKDGIIRYVLDDPSMGIRNDQIYNQIQKLS